MSIKDYIRLFRDGRRGVRLTFEDYVRAGYVGANFAEARQAFGRCIWANVVEMITRLCNDVTFVNVGGGDVLLFADFVRFFNEQGERLMLKVYNEGFAVVGRNEYGFTILDSDKYSKVSDGGEVYLLPNDKDDRIYLLTSSTFEAFGVSDRVLCKPYIEYLDNALNASNTCSARLGALVIASPQSGGPVAAVLPDEQKKKLEEQISKEYGALKKQRQIMLLPRSMDVKTINLAGIDMRTTEKVKTACLVIADRMQVPANQIALIEGTSGKGLTNGGELQQGDFMRYATFERMLNRTFVRLATDVGLRVDYTIYNKPTRQLPG